MAGKAGTISFLYRCHSGFVPTRKCSGGTYSLADTFPRNIFAGVGVSPGTFPHAHKCSRPHKCSASVNERVPRDIEVHYHYRMPELKDVPMIV